MYSQQRTEGRELVQVITMAWLVCASFGTAVVLVVSGLENILILPLAVPEALLFSMVAYAPGLLLAKLFPRTILRHRGLVFGSLPFVVATGLWWFGRDQDDFVIGLMRRCALVDAVLAAA